MPEKLEADFIIVGGGLTGLACASVLQQNQADWLLLEAAPCLGGRVQTDTTVAGYLIDQGFQVLNTSYPSLSRFLNLKELGLRAFAPGAKLYRGGRFCRIGDPLRRPQDFFATLQAPVGTLMDKIKILKLVYFCQRPGNQAALESLTTQEFLSNFGFSKPLIDNFFRPFFGGVFLEEELVTSARKFATLFAYFSRGLATLPAQGMQAIPSQMAKNLPSERLFTENPVTGWKKSQVETPNHKVKGKTLILTGWQSQAKLLDAPIPATNAAISLTFSAPKKVGLGSSYLNLNGTPTGAVQTVAFSSSVQPSYAPKDKELITVSCRRLASAGEVIEELIPWYGNDIREWNHLKTIHIPQALPVELKSFGGPRLVEQNGFRIIACGDHTETGSIQGALTSGSKAATLAL